MNISQKSGTKNVAGSPQVDTRTEAFKRFEKLAKGLISVPKEEADEKAKESTET
jgi:hypothetical protein